MTITVDMGDGKIVEFPDEASANQYFAQQSQQAEPKEAAPSGFLQRAGEFLTAANRRDDIPLAHAAGLGLDPKKAAQMVSLLATTASDDRLQRGLMKIEPGVSFDKDEFGNLVAIWPLRDDQGELTDQRTRFYPNPQGLDFNDLMQASGAVALGTGIGKTAQVIGAPVAGAIGGGLLGGIEAALVEGVSAALTGSPFKVLDVPLGVAGGAGGAKLAGMASRLLPGPSSAATAGLLHDAGVSIGDVTEDAANKIREMVSRGVDPLEAARLVRAQNLPVPVPMTTGQITGGKGQQLFEDMARSGGFGETAERVMQSQRAAQQEAIRGNIPAIQQVIAKGAPDASIGQAGQAAQQTLVAAREAAAKRAGDLFTKARAGGPANLFPAAAADLSDEARAVLRDFNPRVAPNAHGFADDLDDILAQGGDVRSLFQWRQQVTKATQQGGVEGSAASTLKRTFDNRMADLVDRALVSGDEASVGMWTDAIKNYAEFASLWKSRGGVLGALTETVGRDGDTVLKVAPEAVSNYIFGASSNNLISKPALARDLRKLRSVLPESDWGQIRQEAFLRLAAKGEGAFESGARQFSGAKFAKVWGDAVRNNPEVLAALFDSSERTLIKEFADVSSQATTAAMNASNSANSAAGMAQKLALSIGGTNFSQFATRLAGLNMVRSAVGVTRALSATGGKVTPSTVPFGAAGAGGALLSGDELSTDIGNQAARTLGLPQ